MKLFQLAVASIVDANTSRGLIYHLGEPDYALIERHGRSIRARSIAALFQNLKHQLINAFSNYQQAAKLRRATRELARLDDRLLKDIGLSRADVITRQLDQVTPGELQEQGRSRSQVALTKQVASEQNIAPDLKLSASNGAAYFEAKCA